jgi:hypothetical protein
MRLEGAIIFAREKCRRPANGIRAFRCAGLCVFLLATAPAIAGNDLFYNSYGETGLIETPNARMAADGQLSLTTGVIGNSQRINLGFQFLPWLQGSFHYSRIPHWRHGRTHHDHGYGMKIRLSREGEYFPELSAGVRDLLGSGVHGAEYIAASKRIGAIDVTLGLGWGRLAGNGTIANPLGSLFSSFKRRKEFSGEGSQADPGQLFHGSHAGLFGGLAWSTPVDGLTLTAEFSGDKYKDETSIKVRSPVNVGLSYRLTDHILLTGGWLYGSAAGFALTLHADPAADSAAVRYGPAVPPPVIRDAAERQGALGRMQAGNARLALMKKRIRDIARSETETGGLEASQALMDEAEGVRDIDIYGSTLLVDTPVRRRARAQCARLAGIVARLGAHITAIAMTDLENGGGAVTVCPVHARMIEAALREAPPVPAPAMAVTDAAASSALVISEMPDALPQPPPAPETGANDSRREELEAALRTDLAAQSLILDAVSLSDSDLWVYFENRRYARDSEACGRILRLAMARAPPGVEMFHLISVRNGIPLREVAVARSALERAIAAHGGGAELGQAVMNRPPPRDNPALEAAALYPRLHWAFGPAMRHHFFDTGKPFQIEIMAAAHVSAELAAGWTVEGGATANLYDNFDAGQPNPSRLPHVRSDLAKYIDRGGIGMSYLSTTWSTRLSDEVFAQVRAGYLEDMYAGAGGQIVWRPEGSRLAFGADLYQVWKRDYNRQFGLGRYHTATGHVSLYYQTPWHGIDINLHAGRYLAGDYGATIEVTRRFSTGVEVGAFATFTSAPFKKFGEGSFDKGVMIRIPLEWALPVFSRSSYDFVMHALTRDGGQRLEGDASLYRETREAGYGATAEHPDDIVAP